LQDEIKIEKHGIEVHLVAEKSDRVWFRGFGNSGAVRNRDTGQHLDSGVDTVAVDSNTLGLVA
jgi:hypothetical protein